MYNGVYKDKLIDGRWIIVQTIGGENSEGHHSSLLLKNIYNDSTVKISYKQLNDVLNGKTSISHIVCRRIGDNNASNSGGIKITNTVVNGWKRMKHKHVKGD